MLDSLAVKEKILSSMAQSKSIETTIVTCHEVRLRREPIDWLAELANVCWFQCHYTAESMDHSCLERGHKYTRQTAKKRVFQCTECRCYKVTFNARLPSEACSYVTRYFCSHLLNTAHPHPRANRKCQSRSYNLMSVYKEGRDFEARCVSARPEVLARGVEQPFVHPLQSLAK